MDESQSQTLVPEVRTNCAKCARAVSSQPPVVRLMLIRLVMIQSVPVARYMRKVFESHVRPIMMYVQKYSVESQNCSIPAGSNRTCSDALQEHERTRQPAKLRTIVDSTRSSLIPPPNFPMLPETMVQDLSTNRTALFVFSPCRRSDTLLIRCDTFLSFSFARHDTFLFSCGV